MSQPDPFPRTYPSRPPGSPPRRLGARRLAAAPAASVRGDDELESRPGPEPSAARGFVLYVGLSDTAAQEAGTSLEKVANALRVQLAALLPAAETSATLISGSRRPTPADVVPTRRPAASGSRFPAPTEPGLVVDLNRREVRIEGQPTLLAPRELDLLVALVRAPGVTLSRSALVRAVWHGVRDATPSDERAVDVTVARLRSRLGGYAGVVRTVRGTGYRFDAHPDVAVRGGEGDDRFPVAGVSDLATARQLLIEVEKYVNDAC
ncbi:MAG: winged helix-turn-helix transcriptional regulator [Propionibacteriaceae bacterium]|nr:winged helix-turn-helix transcriptional regulator [Propionibacteriaceae bacterium]